MTSLDRRDRRRAKKIVADLRDMHCGGIARLDDIVPMIAKALKQEREEANDAAVAQMVRGFEAGHGKVKR